MRIVAGSARSRTILTPPGRDTRPTLDRVRENLFNILQFRCPQARVLDLFAGSGALALEALSRGAASAVLVDSAPPAHQVQLRNIQALGFTLQAQALLMDWRKALDALAQSGEAFDLIFLDPPYKLTDLIPVTQGLLGGGLLAPEGLVVVEHDHQTEPSVCPGLALKDRRRYGIAGISIFHTAPTYG